MILNSRNKFLLLGDEDESRDHPLFRDAKKKRVKRREFITDLSIAR